jgi:pyruvate/2-oxoglutarate dehydrogenase complex dihydrolipoamide acyltransferase (E2) component
MAWEELMMDIVVPDLGEVGEVKLVRWLVAAGEEVEAGEAVAEVEAEKAVFVVEAPVAGVLDRIIVGPGGATRPGEAIARLRAG